MRTSNGLFSSEAIGTDRRNPHALARCQRINSPGAIREPSGWVGGVRDGGATHTCWDVVEGDAGAGEGVLDGVRDAVGVSVGGDGDGAGVAGGGEGGAHVLGDEVGVADAGDMAVLDVPPHRCLHRCVLAHGLRRRQPRFRRRRGRAGGFFMVHDGGGGGVEVVWKERIYVFVFRKCFTNLLPTAKWRSCLTRAGYGGSND